MDGQSGFAASPTDSITLDDTKQQPSSKPTPSYVREINKLSNTVISSATIALIRNFVHRPTAAPPPENLPPWFASEYTTRSSWQAFLKQYGRDTVILTGAAYLMDGVEHAVKTLRGTDKDPANKMIGGVAAGGVLGMLWYPVNPTGRAAMTAAGAMVGYLTYTFEKTTKVVLFEQQKKLEKEMLHKREEDVRAELDPPYLRQLLRMKQQQLLAEHQQQQQKLKEEHQQRMHGRPAATPGAGALQPGAEGGEEWQSWQTSSSSSSSSSGSGSSTLPGGRAPSLWSQASSTPQPGGFDAQGRSGSSGGADAGARDKGEVIRIGDAGFTAKDSSGRQPRGYGPGPSSDRPGWQSGDSAGSGKKWDSKQQAGDAEWLVISDERNP